MASETAEAAKEQVASTAGTAADEAKSLAGSAQQEVQQVAENAKQQVANVAGEVQAQAQTLMSDAIQQGREQADVQTQRAAEMLRSYEAELRALCEGRPQDAPHLVERLQQASGRISGMADSLENRGIDGVVDDLQRFARRRPGLFLAGAAVAGFVVTRMVRASRQASSPSVSSQPAQPALPTRPEIVALPEEEHAGSTIVGSPAAGTSDEIGTFPTAPSSGEPGQRW